MSLATSLKAQLNPEPTSLGFYFPPSECPLGGRQIQDQVWDDGDEAPLLCCENLGIKKQFLSVPTPNPG